MRRLVYLLISVALVTAACGGDDHDMDAMSSDTTESDAGHGEDHEADSPVPEGARRIEVHATSFAFDPETIDVGAEKPVAIELTAEDAEHDFFIEEIELHVVAAAKGETATGGFIAPAAGEYQFYCAVAGHREAGMEGTLVVS